MMRPLTCPQCGKDSVLRAPCRSLSDRLAGLLAFLPFRCQFCTHRFLAFRWGRTYPRHLLERREHRRIPVRLALSFSGDRVRGEGTLVDISMGGCLIHSQMAVGIDDIMYLRLSIAEEGPPLELAAIVRSVGGRGIRFKFLRAAREDKRLAEFLQAEGSYAERLLRTENSESALKEKAPRPG
ncbi:MAG: PilZ domain-containing protein [Nitrospira sp.]|nr:PilZ domain-containing protein [Nitrospira sp.]